MKASRGLAVFIICVVVVAGAAVTWRLVEAKAAERKLAEDAKACRVRAEGGDAKAQYELGARYYEGKGVAQDYGEAVRWYRKAADQGSAKGQYAVGFMYEGGKGVAQDFAQAIVWFRKSADQGDARAQCALGYTYSLGKGVPKDYATAVEWYRKAADQGNAEAQSELGYMYAEGKGVPQDYSQAVGWYRKAADQGYARGQDGVGYAYFKGAGVPRNYAEAARWYRKAAKQGDEYGRRALGSMNAPFSATREITLSVMFVFCLVLLARSKRRPANSAAAKNNVAGTAWPDARWIGSLWILSLRYSPGAIGRQCFLLRQESFGRGHRRNACSHYSGRWSQDRVRDVRDTICRIQHLCDCAL